MKQKLHIKKGDIVRVIAGDEKGKEGKVLKVFPSQHKAIVKDINIIFKHTKPTSKHKDGGIIEKESPIHISNILVIDNEGNACRIGRRLNSKNKLVRYSKKTGEEIK